MQGEVERDGEGDVETGGKLECHGMERGREMQGFTWAVKEEGRGHSKGNTLPQTQTRHQVHILLGRKGLGIMADALGLLE